jgi:uncharacterized protein HemX
MTQADSNEHDTSSASDTHGGGSGRERKAILVLLVALVLLGGGMYLWKASAVRAVQDKLSQAETQQAQARTQLVDEAKQLNAQSSAESLRRFCMPLAWAITPRNTCRAMRFGWSRPPTATCLPSSPSWT